MESFSLPGIYFSTFARSPAELRRAGLGCERRRFVALDVPADCRVADSSLKIACISCLTIIGTIKHTRPTMKLPPQKRRASIISAALTVAMGSFSLGLFSATASQREYPNCATSEFEHVCSICCYTTYGTVPNSSEWEACVAECYTPVG